NRHNSNPRFSWRHDSQQPFICEFDDSRLLSKNLQSGANYWKTFSLRGDFIALYYERDCGTESHRQLFTPTFQNDFMNVRSSLDLWRHASQQLAFVISGTCVRLQELTHQFSEVIQHLICPISIFLPVSVRLRVLNPICELIDLFRSPFSQ